VLRDGELVGVASYAGHPGQAEVAFAVRPGDDRAEVELGDLGQVVGEPGDPGQRDQVLEQQGRDALVVHVVGHRRLR
jgi:hypothetical protein